MHLQGASSVLRRDGGGPGGNNGDNNNDNDNNNNNNNNQGPGSTPTTGNSTASAMPSASSTGTSSASGSIEIIIPVVVALVAVLALIVGFMLLRRTRAKHSDPKYVPTAFLKRKWTSWNPAPGHSRLPDTNEHLEPIARPRSAASPANFETAARDAGGVANATAGVGVDRNTSVRSVMTLPAYNQAARDGEQVLGREGDRGGIDTVLEYPEGPDEEEERRDAEMEALYQVRLARRRENEEREERRRLRREARERGDYVALRELAAQARAGNTAAAGQTVEELRAEHERIKKERQRAVSSVSYADLGVARHDGTRLRANSVESEHAGLLGDAASIAASSHYHRRDQSTTSILSLDTSNSDELSPRITRSRGDSNVSNLSTGVISHNTERRGSGLDGRAGSSPEIIEHDDIPPNSPPGYENISLDTPHDQASNPLEPPPDYALPVPTGGDRPQSFVSIVSPPVPIASPVISEPSNSGQDASVPSEVRASQIDSLVSEESRNSSSSSLSARTPTEERRGSRGVGGVPQLPSLRLGTLPSIHVDPGSPAVRSATNSQPASRPASGQGQL